MKIWRIFLIFAIITGCTGVPEQPDNICSIFREKGHWYESAYRAFLKWRIPIPVMMAIMHKESGFVSGARPPRKRCLCIFPGPRPSTAFGYPQAIDSTWELYMQKTKNYGADRDDFTDSIDFIGWYCHMSHIICGIAKNDAYNLYLAYHEGQAGYKRGSYKKKTGVKRAAGLVKRQALIYERQLHLCGREFADY